MLSEKSLSVPFKSFKGKRGLFVLLLLLASQTVWIPAALAASSAVTFGTGVATPAISPDGTQIAYQKKTAHGWRICISKMDGTDIKQVTTGPGDDMEPTWRPDGALIAFTSSRSGHWGIYISHPDGAGLRALTHGQQDSRHPQWSPRPFDLVYDKDPLFQKVTDRSKSNISPSDLQMLDMLAKNSSDWSLYSDRFGAYKAARYYKLLFVQGKGDTRQIATIREDGRHLMVLSTGLSGPHLNPCWERTATRFGFITRRGDESNIYSADYPVTRDLNDRAGSIRFGIDQKALRSSLRRVGVVKGPAQLNWSPSGEYLAVASGSHLSLMSRPGLSLHQVSINTGTIAPYGFDWMPDARTVLLTVGDGSETRFQSVSCTEPLLDVVNIVDFEELKPPDRIYLAQNAFVAAGQPEKQMFDVYENTDYLNLPIFITTDSLLHLHHLVFDYLLRSVESEHLAPDVIVLITHYLRSSLDQRKTATDPQTMAAATANAAFFAVAGRLAMGEVHTSENLAGQPNPDDPLAADRMAYRTRQDRIEKALLSQWTASLKQELASAPQDVADLADSEIALIAEHSGPGDSPIFGGAISDTATDLPITNTELDYSDFIPRGHYTRSEVLRRYFLFSHWLNAGSFRRTPDLTRRALLLVSASDPSTMARWQKVQGTVHQFVGEADDQDLTVYTALSSAVYGRQPSLTDIEDSAKITDFLTRAASLPLPKIAPSAGPSFRFLPAPSTPDAEILQRLVYDGNPPDVGTKDQPRYFALGLDVMAVLGSDRAHTLLQTTNFQGSFFDFDLKETQYANYDTQYQALRSQFAAWTEADWSRNLYTRTLYTVLPLLTGQPDTPPKDIFALNPAWTDKSLNTALGTWTELKHDVLPKQPVAIEEGGEGGISESVVPSQPVGFVEPAPEVYRRLALLIEMERKTLSAEGYLTPSSTQRLTTLASLVTMVQNLAEKQASGFDLTAREVEQIRFYGGYQEHLALTTSEGGERGSSEGNDMAIVADISSARSTKFDQVLALEEGVGRALPLYVAVPYHGHRQIARGAVFTYFEFTHPADDRLTDEKWRNLLDTPIAPSLPDWTKSYISRLENRSDDK